VSTLAAQSEDLPSPEVQVPRIPASPEPLALILQATTLLFANAETTERTLAAGKRVAEALGYRANLIPQWDELTARLENGARPQHDIAAVVPTGIDMNKVLAAAQTIDAVSDGRLPPHEAQSAFAKIAALPPVSLSRFILAAAVGASALSVVFGVEHLLSIALIGLSAGTGAAIRRGLSRLSPNFLLQPFFAALLAGLVGGLAQRYQLSSAQALIALCPCMVLVPGPHFLNGLMDLVHARVALGGSRMAYATLVIVAISTGLLLGLWLVGATLPIAPHSRSAPLVVDVIAAGLAVSAYGSFYSMPWHYLPIPILVGMVAHALHWFALSTGASVHAAAFLACLFVGLVITPLANRLRLPFAAMAFAAVVALIPGVFLFRMAAGLAQIAAQGVNAPSSLTSVVLAEGSIAILNLLAMGLGLIAPKLWPESSRSIRTSTTTP
jgi:uncharacterized membrane protein YjjP (DUF1212 family)